jgi:hypothetical protein
MAAIDIGAGADNLSSSFNPIDKTVIDRTNPANDSGEITTFEVFLYYSSLTGCVIGTLTKGTENNYTGQDYESLGSVSAGSKQTFSGKSCHVHTNDVIGFSATGGGGALESQTTGGSGYLSYAGNGWDGSSHAYSLWQSSGQFGLYGTGETAAAGWTTAKLGGIASASIIKVAGIAVASIKKVMGVAVQ